MADVGVASAAASSEEEDDDVDLADCDVFVLDSGAEYTRAGFAGEDEPAVEVRTVVARSDAPARVGRVAVAMGGVGADGAAAVLVGDAALAKRGVLELVRPVQTGLVTDWEALEMVWLHCFAAAGAVQGKCPVVLTEPPLNPRAHREELLRRAFSAFDAPAAYVAVQPVLAAFAAGRTTAMVVDLGASVGHVVPIWEGFCIAHAIKRVHVAGARVTAYLARLLTEKGHYFNTPEELEVVAEMQRRHAYVSLDPELEWLRFRRVMHPAAASFAHHPSRSTAEDAAPAAPADGPAAAGTQPVTPAAPPAPTAGPAPNAGAVETEVGEAETVEGVGAGDEAGAVEERFELPDGREVSLTSERFRCLEAIFSPALIGREEPGLAESALAAVFAADIDVRRDLLGSVVLSGGLSLARGLKARLEKELAAGAPAGVCVRVHAAPERQLLPWQGGALLASLPDFAEMWISRAEYDELGAVAVHSRCVSTHPGSGGPGGGRR